jgi:tripartite-type tricarboxylate transporter receptor subunit TctC
VGSSERSELLPDVPTVKELGYPELAAAPWFALVVPSGTTKDIVLKLNETINATLRDPETKALLAKQGANPIVSSPEQTGNFIRQEIERWAKVVKESGAKLE